VIPAELPDCAAADGRTRLPRRRCAAYRSRRVERPLRDATAGVCAAPREGVCADRPGLGSAARAHGACAGEKNEVEGGPRTDTRAAVGLSRERFEDAYRFLQEHPPLGLAVQRHGTSCAGHRARGDGLGRAALEHPARGGPVHAAVEVLAARAVLAGRRTTIPKTKDGLVSHCACCV
jgi:hypothetical protein